VLVPDSVQRFVYLLIREPLQQPWLQPLCLLHEPDLPQRWLLFYQQQSFLVHMQ
jgi:hypothetical protein